MLTVTSKVLAIKKAKDNKVPRNELTALNQFDDEQSDNVLRTLQRAHIAILNELGKAIDEINLFFVSSVEKSGESMKGGKCIVS